MDKAGCRAARFLQIVALLRDRPRTAQELAELCGVSRRMISRDLIELQMEPLCVPLVRLGGGVWGLDEREQPKGIGAANR